MDSSLLDVWSDVQMDFFPIEHVTLASQIPLMTADASNADTKSQDDEAHLIEIEDELAVASQLTFDVVSKRPLNDYQWTARDVCALLDGLLVRRLQLLNDGRASPRVRRAVIDWMMKPLVRVPPCTPALLSFQSCCSASGLDPEELREQIMRIASIRALALLD